MSSLTTRSIGQMKARCGRPRSTRAAIDGRSSPDGAYLYHLAAYGAPPMVTACTTPWPPSPSRSPTWTAVTARTMRRDRPCNEICPLTGNSILLSVQAAPTAPSPARLAPVQLAPARLAPAQLAPARPAQAVLAQAVLARHRPGSARPAAAGPCHRVIQAPARRGR